VELIKHHNSSCRNKLQCGCILEYFHGVNLLYNPFMDLVLTD